MNVNDLVTQYVTFRRTLGERCNTTEEILRSFCRAVGLQTRVRRIQLKAVAAFLAGNGVITRSWQIKHSVLKGFFRFAVSRGHLKKAPLPTEVPKIAPAVPYIYSRKELRSLIEAIPSCQRFPFRFFQEKLEVNVQLYKKVLEETRIGTSEVVTASASSITARSALEYVLRNFEVPLTWTVEHEILLITTFEEADSHMTTKVYDVTDLVLVRSGKNNLSYDRQTLIEVVIRACDEKTLWYPYDGEGGVITHVELPGLHALVISQTREIHEQIKVVLAGLRRLRRKEPSIFRNSIVKTIPVPNGSAGFF